MSPPAAVYGLIGLWLDAKKGRGDRFIYFLLASEAYQFSVWPSPVSIPGARMGRGIHDGSYREVLVSQTIILRLSIVFRYPCSVEFKCTPHFRVHV